MKDLDWFPISGTDDQVAQSVSSVIQSQTGTRVTCILYRFMEMPHAVIIVKHDHGKFEIRYDAFSQQMNMMDLRDVIVQIKLMKE